MNGKESSLHFIEQIGDAPFGLLKNPYWIDSTSFFSMQFFSVLSFFLLCYNNICYIYVINIVYTEQENTNIMRVENSELNNNF